MRSWNFLALGVLLFIIGCGGEKTDEEKKVEEVKEETKEAVEEVKKEFGSLFKEKEEESSEEGEEGKKSLVHYSKLKELLPEKLKGLPKTHEDGGQLSLGALQYSHVQKVYEKDEKLIEIHLYDYAVPAAPLQVFLRKAKMEYEDDEKVVKTYEEDGAQIWIETSKNSNAEQLGAVINERFVITIQTVELEKGTAKEILEDLDLINKLKELAEE